MSYESDFSGREGVAVITGGSGGIGSAITSMLSRRGSDVAVTYRRGSEKANELVSEAQALGRKAAAYALDLTDAEATAAFLEEVSSAFGGIHTLVYASGPPVPMIHLSRVSPEQFQRQINADAVAFFNLVQPAIPYLRQSAGSIVAVTTAATRRYPVRDGMSSGPKGAVEALVRGFAAEEGRFGIRANCVGPGMLTDGMADDLISSGELDARALEVARGNIALRRFGSAVDIAEVACFLASQRANFITGQMIDVDGGYGI